MSKRALAIAGASSALAVLVYVTSASGKDPAKMAVALDLLYGNAEQCLYDVRDRGFTYETSSNCNSLGSLSLAYINAGGMDKSEPIEMKLKFTQAREMAWMARATSLAGGRPVRIW